MRVWHALWIRRIDAKIEALQRRQAEEEHGRQARPAQPEWIVELGIGTGRPPVQVHAGNCHMAGRRRRPVDRSEARRLLAAGLEACTHCRPDAQLHIIDLGPVRRIRGGAVSSDSLLPVGLPSGCNPYLHGVGRRIRLAPEIGPGGAEDASYGFPPVVHSSMCGVGEPFRRGSAPAR